MISINQFIRTIKEFYQKEGRRFSWREPEHTSDPYKVVVSEIMLQQTQTSRVVPKYLQFIHELPDFQSLAQVSTETLLSLWRGMGYNRRAFALKNIALKVMEEYEGHLPREVSTLEQFPMVGKATARSIAAFAFNEPVVFLETNIRRVFLHFFFQNENRVDDREILPLIEETLDKDNPREWYYALTDYGVMLKSVRPDPNTRSKHYKKQAPFKGSRREVRGKILAHLAGNKELTYHTLTALYGFPEERITAAAESLEKEGLIVRENNSLYLA